MPYTAYIGDRHPTAPVYRTTAWVAGAGLVSLLVGLVLVRRARHGLLRLAGLLTLVGVGVAVHALGRSDSGVPVLVGGGVGVGLVFIGSFERLASTAGLCVALAGELVLERRWRVLRPDDSPTWAGWAAEYDHLVLAVAVVLAVAGAGLSALARERDADDRPAHVAFEEVRGY